MNNKFIFENIYKQGLWNDNRSDIPLSGPGSSLENTKEFTNFLNNFIEEKNINTCCDLGCGDLTWIKYTKAFTINYTGIDIVESLIQTHKTLYPDKKFYNKNIIKDDIPESDLILIRDVIFHMDLSEIKLLFENIKDKFKYLIITSCYNTVNQNDLNNRYNYCEVNIEIEPLYKIFGEKILDEPKFNRKMLVFDNDKFNNRFSDKLFNSQIIHHYGPNDYISRSIMDYKCWEPTITNIFENILKSTDNKVTVFDIGCNIGYYSLVSSKYCENVYSFDGNKHNIELLKKSLLSNDITNINIYDKIISDEEVSYKAADNINIFGQNIGGLSFIKSENSSDDTSILLDNFIEENKIEIIDLMKIDIEGGELKALKGCIKSLNSNKIKNIIIEISPYLNNDSYDILKILEDAGYRLYNIPLKETGEYIYDSTFTDELKSNNYISDINNFIASIDRQTNVLATKF